MQLYAQHAPNAYYAASYVQKIWNNENGLPQNTVSSIIEDEDGYLWMATEEGLSRFDGKTFVVKNEDNTPGLFSNSFYWLASSAQKGIWASSRNTVLFVQNEKYKAYDFRGVLGESWITSIAEDRAGKLWVGTNAGDLFFIENEVIKKFSGWHNASFPISIQTLKLYKNGLLAGTNHGLYFINYSLQQAAHTVVYDSVNVRALAIDSADNIWVGTVDNGLFYLNGNKKQYTLNEGLKEMSIFSLAIAPKGEIWIGTRSKGLQVLSNGKFIEPAKEAFLTDPIQSIFISKQNIAWVGSTGSGLIQMKPAEIHMLSKDIGLSGNIILPIYQHSNGEIWIGTAGKGVNRLVNGKVTTLTTKQGLNHDLILSIYGAGNFIYIATSQGINRFDIYSGKIDKHYTINDGLANNIVKTVFYDSQHRLWACSRSSGIHILNVDGRFRKLALPAYLSNMDFISIFEDSKKNIWIGSSSGTLRIEANGKLKHFGHAEGLNADIVESFYEDRSGAIWMGTDKGLGRYKDDKFSIYSKANGLKFNYISRLIEDNNGYLWLSGSFGLQRIAAKDLLAINDREAHPIIPSKLFSSTDGMANAETNGGIFPAGWKMLDNTIWFPTVEGVAIVAPASINNKIEQVNIELQSIRFGNKEQLSFNNVAIPAGVYNIEIDFTSIDFTNAGDVNYYYRLKGLDDKWIAAGNRRTAYFTGLNQGMYTFEVKAERYGQWSSTAILPFRVNAFFYQAGWFRLLVILIIMALVALFISFQMKMANLKIQEQIRITEAQVIAQERERQHLGTELHDNINQQLTTAQLYLDFACENEGLRLDMVKRSLGVLRNAVQEIRTLCKSLVPPTLKDIGLQEALTELVNSYMIVDKVSIRFESNTDLHELDEKLKLTLYRITQEQLNNIFKYAEATHISILLNNYNECIHLEIKDDGVGFNLKEKSKGLGLTNIKNRLKLYNGTFDIISSPGEGCMLKITTPCRSVSPQAKKHPATF